MVKGYQRKGLRLLFRGDAAFAKPELYEYLEQGKIGYAIRLPANQVTQEQIQPLLERPTEWPSREPIVSYHDFAYQAQSWHLPRRVVAKVEWHQGELFPRVVVAPDGGGAAQNAVCDAEWGGKFAGDLSLTVPGPASSSLPVVSIVASATPVTEGTAAAFTLSRTGATDAALTVAVSVSESEASVSGTPPTSVTFAAASASATLSVATEDDEVAEDASTVTATVSSGSGYTVSGTSGSADVGGDAFGDGHGRGGSLLVDSGGRGRGRGCGTVRADGRRRTVVQGGEGLRGAGRCGHRRGV